MELVAIVIALALLEYLAFGLLVARARATTGIQAPAMTGDPVFERYVRVHQNTLEQLAIFLPAIVLFGSYVSTWVASILGLVFIAGRIVYLRGYVEDPAKRSTGFLIGEVAQVVLLLGGGIGALVAWV
jgi:uncharacterized membrane protein YecN with MAPEG domain